MSGIPKLAKKKVPASSEVSRIYSTFINLIVIINSITIIIIITNITIIAIIINSTKDDFWDMNELFYKLPNFGEQSSKPGVNYP